MKLSEYLKTYYDLSAKASDVSRQLALAGIALIWIFKTGEINKNLAIPGPLIYAAFCFALALAADLSHYIIAAATWGIFHRIMEKKLKEQGVNTETVELTHSRKLNWPTNILFWSKVLLVIIGYGVLGSYIWSILPNIKC